MQDITQNTSPNPELEQRVIKLVDVLYKGSKQLFQIPDNAPIDRNIALIINNKNPEVKIQSSNSESYTGTPTLLFSISAKADNLAGDDIIAIEYEHSLTEDVLHLVRFYKQDNGSTVLIASAELPSEAFPESAYNFSVKTVSMKYHIEPILEECEKWLNGVFKKPA